MKILEFPRRKPHWEDERVFRERICSALLDAGLSATEAAEVLLYAAYDLHCHTEGADHQHEGWKERADRSFQKAVAGFCAECVCSGLDFDEHGSIRLPYP